MIRQRLQHAALVVFVALAIWRLGTPNVLAQIAPGKFSNIVITSTSGLSLDVAGGAQFGTPATLLITTLGKIPDLSSLYFEAISASNFTTGTVPTARLGSGTASVTTVLRGDSTWGAYVPTYAVLHATPADPTGSANTVAFLMMGLGATCALTPTINTRVVLTFSGDVSNPAGASNGGTWKIAYGTGTAPANGAAASGTVASATQVWVSDGPGGLDRASFSVTTLLTGLTINTAYWFDLQLKAVVGGTVSLKNIDCTAHEI